MTSAAPPPANEPPAPVPAPSTRPAPVRETRREPAPEPRRTEEVRTIPAGATLQVRNNETINSDTASVGQTYSGVVAQDLVDTDGRVAIPRGSDATLIVRGAASQGKVQGRSELALDVASVRVGGRTYRLETTDLVQQGSAGIGKNKRTGEFVGGGTALGGIIGAIAGRRQRRRDRSAVRSGCRGGHTSFHAR